MYKFEKLKNTLLSNQTNEIKLTQDDLNRLIEGGLSQKAFISRSYFANDETHAIYNVWKSCGYICTKVDRINNFIILSRIDCNMNRIMSSDLIYSFFVNDVIPEFKAFITPFTYSELFRSRDIEQEKFNNYLINSNYTFLNFTGNQIPFEEFYSIVNSFDNNGTKLIYRMSHTYEGFVRYVFQTVLLNILPDSKIVIDSFYDWDKSSIIYFSDSMNEYSLRNAFQLYCDELDIKPGEILSKVKNIQLRQIQKPMIYSGCTPLEKLFYDYALTHFVEEVKNDRFIISPFLIEEMLNVSFLSYYKGFSYYTNRNFTKEIVVSSLKNRIIMEDEYYGK